MGESGSHGRVGGSSKGYGSQWFPDLIRLNQAHSLSTGQNVIVAVLDTGIDLTHPAFAGRLVPGYDFVDDDNDPSEEGVLHQNPAFGHGTHVAGIIHLTAPDAKIMPLRILDENGEGQLWRVKDAIVWAAHHLPKGKRLVVNMSFAYPREYCSGK